MQSTSARSHLAASVAFWVIVLLAVGGARRWVEKILSAAPRQAISPAAPLSRFPMHLGEWEGVDVPIDARVQVVAGNDDYVNRRYLDRGSGATVDFYLGFTTRPSTMLGHRPDACYPANGWVLRSQERGDVRLPDGSSMACLVHEFGRQEADSEAIVVVNYYALQGRHTTEWKDFWGPRWRSPNLSRDPRYYVAQVQIAAGVAVPQLLERAKEQALRFAAASAADVRSVLTSIAPPASGGEARGVRQPSP